MELFFFSIERYKFDCPKHKKKVESILHEKLIGIQSGFICLFDFLFSICELGVFCFHVSVSISFGFKRGSTWLLTLVRFFSQFLTSEKTSH